MCKGISNSVNSIIVNHVGLIGGRYIPLIVLMFLTILIINILGLTPYAYTPTSHLSFTIFLSVAVITACTIIGFTHYGVQFFAIFIPEGTPLMLIPLLVLIETVSYIARAFSLGIRLGANIIAGHSLLVIISSFVYIMLSPLSGLVLFCPIGLLIIFALFLMELGVAILQAYVFMLLTTSYLHDGLYLH
jgi:F-type H+-transporting ATPase subunit a